MKSKIRLRRFFFHSAITVATGTLVALPSVARADWTGTIGPWSTPANWGGTVPASGVNAVIRNGGTAQIVAGNTFTNAATWIGDAGAVGNVTQTGGTLNSQSEFGVGHNGGTGTYNFRGGTINNTGGNLIVGDLGGGNGTLNLSGTVTNGTNLYANNFVYIGNGNSTGVATGIVTVSGLSFLHTNGQIQIGSGGNGNGTATISDSGRFASGGTTSVGCNGGGTGVLNITGGTASNNALVIASPGDNNTGTVNLSGGTLTDSLLTLGGGTTNNAQLNVSGTGALTVGNDTNLNAAAVGATGSTSITVSGGTATFNGEVHIGQGVASVNQTTSVFTVSGGTVYANSYFTVGRGGGTGVVNLNGGILQVAINLNNEGTAATTYNLNGGTIRAGGASDQADFIHGNTPHVYVRNGGAIFDTNGHNDTINVAINHSNTGGDNATDGGLTKFGAGTLILINVTHTYTGPTIVNAGTLSILFGNINTTSGVFIGAGGFNYSSTTALSQPVTFLGTGGTLSGTGTITPAVMVPTGNTVAPGGSTIGPLSIKGGLVLQGTYQCQINTDNTATADKLAVTGTLNLTGATLSTSNLGTGIPPAVGTKCIIATYTTLTGTFAGFANGATVTISGVDYTINYADGGNSITLTVPGTFDIWMNTYYPGLTGADALPTANPMDDGISNLMKYALGMDPTVTAQPPGVRSANTLTFTKGAAAKVDSSIAYSIEESTDLVTWTAPSGPPPSGTVVYGADTITYTFPSGPPGMFARLKVLSEIPVVPLSMSVSQDGTVMTVTGTRYTACLTLPEGVLISLKDQAAGQNISLGNTGDHLWVAHFTGRNDVNSGNYAAASMTRSWDPVQQTLTILYSQAGLPAVRAQWSFSNDAWMDLSITLNNQTGYVLSGVEYNLRMPTDNLQSAILPVLPGIQFQRNFFTEGQSWNQGTYPRALVFADYAHFRACGATLTTFPILNQDLTQVASHNLFPDGNTNTYVWRHNFVLTEASGTTWTSPRLRLRVGDSETDGARAFRDDTGLGLVPSLRQKLGTRYDRVASSLSTKVGADWMLTDFGLTLANQTGYSNMWRGLPGPALLFIVGWSRGGSDESNPDIFPVDPKLGTDDQWKQVFQSASAAGHLNMPYLNPSFWNANSETVKSMTPTLFAAYKIDGTPQIENYGNVLNPHMGYATCPYAPATQTRLASNFVELSQKMPVDLVWEDQVGARYGADYSTYTPNPMRTAQGWLAHTRTQAQQGLMTEFGYDRMVETHVGFQGNYLLAQQENWGDFGPKYWGVDTWRIWPVVPMMARDKVMFYNTPDNNCVSKQVLTWSLAMGQMLSWALTGGHYRDPWHFTADAFQRHVMARYADQTLQDFAVLPDHITRSSFGDYTVWANESQTQDWQAPTGPRLAPGGCWVTDRQGLLSAGIFTAFNGQPLTAGDHYLIVETRNDGLTVRHLQGPDTPLILQTAKPVQSVTAQFDQGNSQVPFHMENGQVYLDVHSKLLGQDVRSYELSF